MISKCLHLLQKCVTTLHTWTTTVFDVWS